MSSHTDDCTCMACVPTVKTWTVSGPAPDCSAPLPTSATLAVDAASAGYATNAVVQSWIPEPHVSVAEKTIFDLVKADLDERYRFGREIFKQPITVDTYSQWLQWAYEEALDLCVYLRGALAEREVKK